MRRKVLPGIRHYNEGWFRSCYYHQLIAGLSYYGIPAQAVICNYAMEVVPADRLTDFRFVERDILNERNFSALVGVSMERRRTKDVVRAAVECVDRGMPLIVALDNFYLPYRADYYRKSHYLHFVLVYGYDPDLGALIAGEHEYTTSYDFQEPGQFRLLSCRKVTRDSAHISRVSVGRRAAAERSFRAGKGGGKG